MRTRAGAGAGSVTDIFQEVDEEVRREQLKKLWERYGHYIIAACILVIVGVAGGAATNGGKPSGRRRPARLSSKR